MFKGGTGAPGGLFCVAHPAKLLMQISTVRTPLSDYPLQFNRGYILPKEMVPGQL